MGIDLEQKFNAIIICSIALYSVVWITLVMYVPSEENGE